MENTSPTHQEWKRLYDNIIALKPLEPWQWIPEPQLFAVPDPVTDEIGFTDLKQEKKTCRLLTNWPVAWA